MDDRHLAIIDAIDSQFYTLSHLDVSLPVSRPA